MPPRDPLALLLPRQYPHPGTREMLAAESRAVVIEDSLDGREGELIHALELGPKIAVLSDRTTHAVLGARVERSLGNHVQSIMLDAGPRADEETVERLLSTLASGTDL